MSDNSSNSSTTTTTTTTKKNKYENVQEAIEALRIGVGYDPTNAQANAFLRELELESLSLPKDYFEMKVRAKEMFRGGKFEDASAVRRSVERRGEEKGERGEVWRAVVLRLLVIIIVVAIVFRATLFLNRAECYRQMGQMQECEKDCEEALQFGPQNEKGLLRRALCREHFERFDEALKISRARNGHRLPVFSRVLESKDARNRRRLRENRASVSMDSSTIHDNTYKMCNK